MSKLLIKNSIPVQKDFWGNGAIYHGYAGMPDDAGRVYTEEQCEEEARRVGDLRLKIARTFYGWWAWDEKTDTWDWDNDRMRPFYRWLGRMKEIGVTVALNTGWCSPGDINSTCWNGKSPFTVEGDWEKSLENYGNWVSETYYQLVEKRGFDNVKIFVMFTEPQRFSGKPNEEGQTPYSLWHDAVRAAHNALVRDGYRDKIIIMGPNEGSTTTSHMLKWVSENASDIVDLYSSHNYQWVPATKKEFIKSGKTSPCLCGKWSRICREVAVKPNTEYEAVIDMLYRSDFSQEGGFVWGAYKYHEGGDLIAGGLLPSAVDGSVKTVYPADLTRDYQKLRIRFNSGDNDRILLGIFCAVEPPKELTGKTLALSEYKGMEQCIAYVDSLSLIETASGENVVDNHDFSENYEGWFHSSTAGGLTDPYYDWVEWANIALDFLPGDDNDKPYCYDEYNICYNRDNSRNEYGSEVVGAAVALMNSGVRATMLWTLFDQQWPDNHTNNADSFIDGDHRCGTMPNLRFSRIPHTGYYAFSLLSRYIGGKGTKVYKGEGENCLNATYAVSPDGEVTVLVVNSKETADDFTIEFEKALGLTLNRHLCDPATLVRNEKAELIGTDKVFESIENTLSDTIPPYSVAVYTTYLD